MHLRTGERAHVIGDLAEKLNCDRIVLGTARKTSLTRMFQDAVIDRLLDRTVVPIELIAGDTVSAFERYGVPIGIGAGIGLLLLALD